MLVSASFRRRCFSHRKALNNRITALSSQTPVVSPPPSPPPAQFSSRPTPLPPPHPITPTLCPAPGGVIATSLSRVDTTRPMRFVFAVPYFLGVLFASAARAGSTTSVRRSQSEDDANLRPSVGHRPVAWLTLTQPQPPGANRCKSLATQTVTLEHTRGWAETVTLKHTW